MCGIAGKYCLKGKDTVSLDLIKRMTGMLHHRGPDESGIYIDDSIGLGHARLSIIDLSHGSQPIHNEDRTMWIIYNGEIFNYPELKLDLINKGHVFYTSTDTEVLLHLYEEKGADCLQKLNGQFAFAIWDSKRKELFLARDRVGIRPLYYAIQNDKLLFASEIKSIFMDEEISREIDTAAMSQIFTFWSTLPPSTFFKGIMELPPGCYMIASKSSITIKKYWEIPFYAPEDQLNWTDEKICEQINELLTDAIRIRLRADVPVGCYLSGGLDSSVITTLVVKNFNSRVRTFGVRFEEKEFDEGAYQNQMVSFLETDHAEINATNDMIGSALPDVLWHAEKPLLRTAPVPLFLLSDLVNRSGFKVVLTGEGADEIFGGYNIFREAKVRNFWARQPDSKFRGLLIKRLYPYIFKNQRLSSMQKSFFGTGLDRKDDPFFSHHLRWQTTGKTRAFFSNDIKSDTDLLHCFERLKNDLPDSFLKWDYLARAQYLEMKTFLSNYLLSSQGDRVAMAHSVEIRLPYLDYRLIDFMGRVPAVLKIKGLNEKYILKKTFHKILPQEITSRPKHPYRAPIKGSLFNEEMSEYVDEMLSDDSLMNSGLFDKFKAGKFLNKIKRTETIGEVDSMALAGILSTQIIYDQFIANFRGRCFKPFSPPEVVADFRT